MCTYPFFFLLLLVSLFFCLVCTGYRPKVNVHCLCILHWTGYCLLFVTLTVLPLLLAVVVNVCINMLAMLSQRLRGPIKTRF